MRRWVVLALLVSCLSVVVPTTSSDAVGYPSWYRPRPACAVEGRALRNAGLSRYESQQGEWIAWRESRCGAALVGPTDDHGPWQIHAPVWLKPLCRAGIACHRSELHRTSVSARAVVWMFGRSGWGPWCYRGDCPWA